jgi:hypothetical protein
VIRVTVSAWLKLGDQKFSVQGDGWADVSHLKEAGRLHRSAALKMPKSSPSKFVICSVERRGP